MEQETLAVVQCLAEVRWLVVGSRYPTMVYTNHMAFKFILTNGSKGNGRIARWQDRLGEYNIIMKHQTGKNHLIGIANGLNRMPTQLTVQAKAEDKGRMVMLATGEETQDPMQDPTLDSTQWEIIMYLEQYFLELNYNFWDRYLQSNFCQNVAEQILNGPPLH